MEIEKVVCIQCHNACRLAAIVDENRLLSVEPDEDSPGTKSSYPITKADGPFGVSSARSTNNLFGAGRGKSCVKKTECLVLPPTDEHGKRF